MWNKSGVMWLEVNGKRVEKPILESITLLRAGSTKFLSTALRFGGFWETYNLNKN